MELAIWRAHHARFVAAASPLALDLLSQLGLGADALAADLRPRADWRRLAQAPTCDASLPTTSLGEVLLRAGKEKE